MKFEFGFKLDLMLMLFFMIIGVYFMFYGMSVFLL